MIYLYFFFEIGIRIVAAMPTALPLRAQAQVVAETEQNDLI